MNHPQRWALSAVLAGLALSVPLSVQAQSVPAFQSGRAVPGDLLKSFTNGLHGTVGGILGDSLTAKGVNPFAITDGNAKGLCLYTATSNPGTNAFCLGHDVSGNPVFTLNGLEYPVVSQGNGTVFGANPSTPNSLAVWNDGAGTQLRNPTASVSGDTSSTVDTFLNKLVITTDAINAGGNNVWGLAVNETCCTSTAKGQRFLLGARLDITGASNAADPLPDYVAVFGNTRSMSGIVAPNASAGVWGGDFNTQLGAGSTGWAEAIGVESDVTVQAGASVIRKTALAIVQGGSDAVHGSSVDGAITVFNAPGASAPWSFILDIDHSTVPVISTTGAIIRSRGAATFADVIRMDSGTTVTNGLNMTNATVSNAVVLGPGGSSYIKGDGSAFFTGVTQGVGNGVGVYPTSLSGWALTSNFAAASEVDFWNTYNSGGAFRWYQKTAASAATLVGSLADAGGLATTGLSIRINNTAAGLSLSAVLLGAPDSGGTGRRALTVAN